jgi:hypothetical protein
MKKILFDETHGEVSKINDDSQSGMSLLGEELIRVGYAIVPITGKLESSLKNAIKGTNLLWISFPTKEFDTNEQETILEFVKSGGGLLLTAEWGDIFGNVNKLNSISEKFGMKFRTDRVTDHTSSYTEKIEVIGEVIGVARIPQFLKIKDFRAHPIIKNVKEIGYFAGCSIEAPEEKWLAWSGKESFRDLNANAKLDPGELVGPSGLICLSEHDKGRVACMGDTSMITNKYIHYADNHQFSLNLMKWLSKEI